MKKLLKLFVFVLVVGSVGLSSSCSDDDDKNPPVITYPDNGNLWEVNVGENLDFVFTVEAEGGYSNHTLEGIAGSITSDNSTPGDGAVNFTISGTYTAGDVSGPGAIKLTVSDNEGAQTTSTIGVDILNN